jgi:maltooligosyltrehalose trehalohydrolase
MPFGAELRDGGGVDFRLWAPAASHAELLFYHSAAGQPQPLPAQADRQGWWSCFVPEAQAGSLYHWRIGQDLLVPDPASRQNPRGVFQPSAVVDPLQFEWDGEWKGRPWHEAVLYEMHVGAFTEEGTFLAAAEKLAELAEVGITALQLMPLADFPGRFGWGYDGVLPFAPHCAYGTPDELKHFIQQAHRLGLMVFVDVVYNHFGPAGNMLPAYAPEFFSASHRSPWGAAINFDGPASRTVRDFFIHNALYWVQEYRVDGLRLDAVHAIVDQGAPHILEEISQAVRQATPGRHVHLTLENEHDEPGRLAAQPQAGRFDAQWNDHFHHALHVALTGETHGYYGKYGKDPIDQLGRALSDGVAFDAPPRWLPSLVHFAHNHDQTGNRAHGERLSQLAPPEAAALATLLALLTPAIPMLFFGEEFGAPEPFLYFADWEGELRDAVRAGRKREFGHSGRALPDPCSEDTYAASRPDRSRRDTEEGRRRLALVRSALAARASWITPRQSLLLLGRHSAQRIGERGLAVQWRYADGQMLALELNLGAGALQVPEQHEGPVQAQLVFSHNRPEGTDPSQWPAWSARWTLGAEITQ